MNKFYQEEYLNLTKILNMLNKKYSTLIYAEHICGRIKSEESVISKLNKKNITPTLENALDNLNDIIGIRIIVRFIDDIYSVKECVSNDYEVINEKDYIKKPKQNGYRSLHLIINYKFNKKNYPIEIQIRTISQDSWASLEHKMKYKKEVKHLKLISSELKRCADEMASIDISMQTINEMIHSDLEEVTL